MHRANVTRTSLDEGGILVQWPHAKKESMEYSYTIVLEDRNAPVTESGKNLLLIQRLSADAPHTISVITSSDLDGERCLCFPRNLQRQRWQGVSGDRSNTWPLKRVLFTSHPAQNSQQTLMSTQIQRLHYGCLHRITVSKYFAGSLTPASRVDSATAGRTNLNWSAPFDHDHQC